MKLDLITPHPALKPYLAKMWVFYNKGRLPHDDMKIIVPNGMVKLVIPIHNGLSGKYANWQHLSKESSITLIGIADLPAIVDVEQDAPHTNIGLEFSPLGAYRLFHVRQSELKNKIFTLEEVLGKSAKTINERIANTEAMEKKIQLLQSYLLSLLSKSQPDILLDFCIQQIERTKGLITVADLEKKTGYSSRWLHEKFMEKVGLSPKNLSSVTRFMQFYEASASTMSHSFFKNELYHYFYDQAHFSKEFKRFTGMSPARFFKTDNDFGQIFYKG